MPTIGIRGGRRVWQEGDGRKTRYYTWDSMHGELEVFNRLGWHLGAVDPVTGTFLKPPVESRRLEL